MKRTSKAFCLLFVVIMLFALSITAFAGNETNDGNIKIQVATNKGSYGVTDIAEITATITNVSDKDINNVTAQAVFDDLAPAAKKKSQTSKSVDVLKSGESFSFKYKVTLNEDKHKINFFQKIILWFVRLFNGGYNASNNNIDVVTECVTEIKFGKFTAKNVVQVECEEEHNIKFEYLHSEPLGIDVGKKENVLFYVDIKANEKLKNTDIELFVDKKLVGTLNDDGINGDIAANDNRYSATITMHSDERKHCKYYVKYKENISDVSEFDFYKSWSETEKQMINNLYADIAKIKEKYTITEKEYSKQDKNAILKATECYNEIIAYLDNRIDVVFYEFTGFNIMLEFDCAIIIGIPLDDIILKENSSTMSLRSLNIGSKKTITHNYQSKFKILTLQPYRDSEEFDNSVATDEAAQKIADAFGYTFKDNLDNEYVTVEALKSFEEYGVIILEGHGGNFGAHRYVIPIQLETTIENYTNYIDDIKEDRLYPNGDYFVVTEKFFDYHYSENDLDNTIIYFGTCHGGDDNVGIRTIFQQKGAEAVMTYKNSVIIKYMHELLPTIFERLSKGDSVEEAVSEAKNKHGNHDPYIDGNTYNNLSFWNKVWYNLGLIESSNPAELILTGNNTSFQLFGKSGNYITGTVTDEETGEPIPNAWVIADSGLPEKHIAFTDENGRYELALPDTLCEFEFYHENYVEKKFSRHISADMQINVSLTPKSTIKNILLDNTWYNNIQDYCEYKFYEDGTVVENPDSDFSRTMPYSITDNVLNIYWDESGEAYSTSSLKYVTKNDSYNWDKDLFFYNVIYNKIADDEYFFYEYDYEPDEMGLENAMWLRCKNDTVEDDRTFTGTVLDEATEAPISNVVVNITEQGDSLNNILEMVITDENGNFSLNLPDGDYTLEFLHDNYELDFAFITIGSDENNSSFYLTPLETRTITASGNCGANGDNVTWTLYDDGELVISGSGEMKDYTRAKAPWYSLRSSITKLTIKEGVTSVGNYSFFYCDMMNTATIVDTVVRIGEYAFYECENLLNIKTLNNVELIASYAFAYCKSLNTITINANLLHTDALSYCENLSEIKFGSNVEKIDTNSNSFFNGCSKLTRITVDKNNLSYMSDETGVLFNKEKTILVIYPRGKSDGNYITPGSVTTIGEYAFSDCDYLESINISESVTDINEGAFSLCSNLTSVSLPEKITNIPKYAFYYCTSLKNITIPDDVVNIGFGAFKNCTNFTDIKLSSGVSNIDNFAFESCINLTNIKLPDSVSNIDNSAFNDCTSLESITVDENNNHYSNDEYGVLFNKDKTNLIKYPMGNIRKSYTVPASVTVIDENAFYKSKKLESINLPDSLTSICFGAFSESGLKSISIPDNVINIGSGAFKKCTRLVSVTIPNSITKIGYSLFEGCIYLTNINLPNSITHIDNYAFADCTYLTSIKLPDSIISIGSYAFEDCRYLTNIRLSYNLTNIAQGAFSGCTNLKDVYYTGTQEEWNNISIGSNATLTNATIHYNYNA